MIGRWVRLNSWIVFLCILLFLPAGVFAWPIPDTGQTKCYNNTAEIPCPAPGEAFYGQDGNYTINPTRYVKVDGGGNDLPDNATIWYATRDDLTGIVWEMKTTDGTKSDKNYTCRWDSPNPCENPGSKPTLMQLLSIVDFSGLSLSLNAAFFPNTQAGVYHTSDVIPSSSEDWPKGLYAINFSDGSLTGVSTSSDTYIRNIIAGGFNCNPTFVDNGDGTVTDTCSNIMWQKEGVVKTWQEALEYAEGLTLASYDDWRLPNIREIFTGYFTSEDDYWSSTTYASNPGHAWLFSPQLLAVLGNSYTLSREYSHVSKTSAAKVRAIRGGQNRLPTNLYIVSPLQGDKWIVGTTIPITWDSQGIAGKVKISLSRQGGKANTYEVIAQNLDNSGYYPWTVSGTSSTICMIRIEHESDSAKATTQGLFTIAADDAIPYGSISINAGAERTNNVTVSLNLTATGSTTITQMQFSNDNVVWSASETFSAAKTWSLSGGDGMKTVYVRYKDAAGRWSTSYADTIAMDTQAPTTIAQPAGGVYLGEQTITLTPNEGAAIYYTTDGSTPTTSSQGYGPAISIKASSVLKFFAVDATGNQSSVHTETYTINYPLTVTRTGSGSGLVTLGSGTLSWENLVGTAIIASGTNVSLKALADADAMFAGWTGACQTMGNCTVAMDQARSVTANFKKLTAGILASMGRPIPDTGQTICYNLGNEIPCPAFGEAFYGQDGNYTINPPSYTKLNAAGNALPDDATAWAMTRDNVTGLIWENKTNDGSIHDGSNAFTWCDRNPAINNGDQGTCGTGTGNAATDTEAFVNALNDARFGGFSDWRMPTAKELPTILDRNRTVPSVNTTWFSDVVSPKYWSSSTCVNNSSSAWFVSFGSVDLIYGNVSNASKASAFSVRAVRGGRIESRYFDNGDGTVTDSATGLMWQQAAASGKNWQTALDYAEALTLAGYSDWRLPHIDELQSIVDYGRHIPSIDTTTFPGMVSTEYRSSTTYPGVNYQAWLANFSDGLIYYNFKTATNAVRVVRGGQPRSSGCLVISAPGQAARWEIGKQQSLLWDTAGIAGNVRITLSRQGGKDGTFTETIAESVPNSGSYSWEVTGPESVNCVLRIEPLNDSSKSTTQGLFSVGTLQQVWIEAEKHLDTAHYKLNLKGLFTWGISMLDAVWTSSDPATATISGELLTAMKNGYVDVSTLYGGVTYKKGLFVYTTLDAAESEGNNTKDVADIMTASTADPTISKFYKGTLTTGDTDWFKFTLSQGALVNVGYLSQSSTAEIRMDLYNASDILLASGTSENGAPLIFPVGLAAGDYYLKLSIAGDVDQTGNYIVDYKILGNLPANVSVPIAIGETKTGTIGTLADKQELTFTLAEAQGISILFTPSSPTAKYHLTLLDTNQTVIDQIDCLNQMPVSFKAVYGTGNYTLRVTPVDVVDAQNPFSLSLNTADGQLEKEPNETADRATPFDITRTMMGRVSSSGDGDFYTFRLDAPRFLEMIFSATGSTGNFSLAIFKESDQYEIDGIDITNGQSTTLHMGLSAGKYFLRVKGGTTNIDTIHNYTLSFTDSAQTDLEIESNNTQKVANAIDKTQAKRGRIYSSQDKDYFGFHVPEGGFITFLFTPTTTTGDYRVSLVDENEQAGALYTYISTNGAAISAADLYLDVPGNYYLKVEPNGDIDQYKPYSISLASAVAIAGLKQLVNVAVTGLNQQMTVSDTQTLTAKAGYSDATIANVTPTWTSLNPDVATVNGAGLVMAVAQGTTSIVASYGGITGKFDLTVGAPQNVVKQHYGNLILVAGGGIAQTNTLKESTQYLSDLVYRRFKARLFTDEDIYYFNPLPFHDLNGDGFGENIVKDTAPTVAKFGAAITSWAASQSTDGPLYIYLIDHGDLDSFQIFPGENLTAVQLKNYIDAFQTATNRQVIVMIEACKSGSFANDLVTTGQNRIVVTSTSDQYVLMSPLGTDSFTQFFTDKLWEGDSIQSAYTKATQKLTTMGAPYSQQTPQISEGVNFAATNVRIGGNFVVAGAVPEFTGQTASKAIAANTTQNLYATLDTAVIQTIEKVWAVIIPPVYQVSGTETQIVQFPTTDLLDADRNGQYDGSYNVFTYNGDYRITFYARNTNGNIITSAPTVFTVSGGQSTGTPGDVNGDGAVTLTDAILALQIMAGLTPPAGAIQAGYNPLAADVNNDAKIGLPEVLYILQKAAGVR